MYLYIDIDVFMYIYIYICVYIRVYVYCYMYTTWSSSISIPPTLTLPAAIHATMALHSFWIKNFPESRWKFVNRSRCPLGYKPCEHRKIESSLILSCGVHRPYIQVDIGYNYQNTDFFFPNLFKAQTFFETEPLTLSCRTQVSLSLAKLTESLSIRPITKHRSSREKWRKCISVTGSLRGQAQVRPKDKLDEACTNADDRMMLVQHCSGDRVMS